tara:strand:- start:2600 stop:2719 length:120 start_codon:yes stop_codon:yes gene_type:complete
MKNPTLVVVTERNELDGQLYQQFCMANVPECLENMSAAA